MHILACASPAGLIAHAGSEPLKGSGTSPPSQSLPTARGLRNRAETSLAQAHRAGQPSRGHAHGNVCMPARLCMVIPVLTPFLLNSIVPGGLIVLGMPLAYRLLLSIRYRQAHALDDARGEGAEIPTASVRHRVDAAAVSSGENSVIGSERLESLRAFRTRSPAASLDLRGR